MLKLACITEEDSSHHAESRRDAAGDAISAHWFSAGGARGPENGKRPDRLLLSSKGPLAKHQNLAIVSLSDSTMIFRVDLVCHPKRANTPAQKTAHNNVRVIWALLPRTQVSYFGNSIKQRLGLMVLYPPAPNNFSCGIQAVGLARSPHPLLFRSNATSLESKFI